MFSIGGLGGAERSLTRMSVANGAADVNYLLTTLGGAGDWSAWLSSCGWDGTTFDVRILWPWSVVRFVRAMRREAPDVIYTVGVRVYLLMRLLRWFLRPVKVVQAIRATYPPGSSAARRYAMAERLFSRADAYIANSHAGAKSFSEVTGVEQARIRVIFNGVDHPKSLPPTEVRIPHQVLIVANLQPRKGHIAFLEVVREVVRVYPDATFVFAGRDDMGGAVRVRATEMGLDHCITFAGYCADVSQYLRKASLFVLPSRFEEGAPTSILEALAYGLPVVAFAAGGVGEIVQHGVDGVVVNDLANESLAREIVALMGDDARRQSMGKAGHERTAREYSLQACAARHAEVWRSLKR